MRLYARRSDFWKLGLLLGSSKLISCYHPVLKVVKLQRIHEWGLINVISNTSLGMKCVNTISA